MIWTAALLSTAALAAPSPAPYQAVLDQHLRQGRVDYAAIQRTGALDGTLDGLAKATEPTAPAEKMAFWINAYNALTIDLIADEWPVSSIRDLDGGKVWDSRSFTVAGRAVTLNDIEHRILRPMGDPRIHAAVNCASVGCPPLPAGAFTAANLDAELTAASRRWVASNGASIDQAGGVVRLSRIFDWYGDDFVPRADRAIPGLDPKQAAAIDFLADHAEPAVATWLAGGGYRVEWQPYDWAVNAR